MGYLGGVRQVAKWLSEALGWSLGEAGHARGLSLLLLPLQPQSGVRQAGEREDGDATPLCDGERLRGLAGGRARRQGGWLGPIPATGPPRTRWRRVVERAAERETQTPGPHFCDTFVPL